MSEEQTTIVLGDEYDDMTRDALRTVLVRIGAVGMGQSWGVGGSQEIETLAVQLGTDEVIVEAETFIGLTITGPRVVVENIALQVRQQLVEGKGGDPS